MWTIAQYQATAFFSLRPSTATSTGGKTLLVPTPFAIKTALLDVVIRTQGLAQGQTLFPQLRALQIAVQLPERMVVNNTFAKIWRYNDAPTKSGSAMKEQKLMEAKIQRKWPYQSTIGFREYVCFGGPLGFAFQGVDLGTLLHLLAQVNYLGKRGGFVQLLAMPEEYTELPMGFTLLTQGWENSFPLGTLQIVDDWGEKLTFERLDSYSDQVIRAGTHRIFRQVVLPCRPVFSSRGYTLYERF